MNKMALPPPFERITWLYNSDWAARYFYVNINHKIWWGEEKKIRKADNIPREFNNTKAE